MESMKLNRISTRVGGGWGGVQAKILLWGKGGVNLKFYIKVVVASLIFAIMLFLQFVELKKTVTFSLPSGGLNGYQRTVLYLSR